MQKRAVAIIIKDNKVLLIRRVKEGKEYFVFPGGGVEQGESDKQAVVREIKEELGLNIQVSEPFFEIETQEQQEIYFLIKNFIGEPKLGGEEKERMNKNNQYHPGWYKIKRALVLPHLHPERARQKLNQLLQKYEQ